MQLRAILALTRYVPHVGVLTRELALEPKAVRTQRAAACPHTSTGTSKGFRVVLVTHSWAILSSDDGGGVLCGVVVMVSGCQLGNKTCVSTSSLHTRTLHVCIRMFGLSNG